MSANRAKLDCAFDDTPINTVSLRFNAGKIAKISSLSPELDNASTTSPSTIIPKSPCAASAGCTKNAGVPVEASVAAILRPICPDLPMPVTITRPRQANTASAARTKSAPSPADTSPIAAASLANASRAHKRY